MSEAIPEATIFHDPATGCYGFRTRSLGHPPHRMIGTFNPVEDVLGWYDPHRECGWEDATGADEMRLLIARDFKRATVGWRMAR